VLVRPRLVEQVDIAALRNRRGLVAHQPRQHGLVQVGWLKVIEKRDTWNRHATFTTWAYTVAWNRMYD
jgi:DNA-directed RNA polymerase specialized sigma24 family protein